jgi:hypothetical protein
LYQATRRWRSMWGRRKYIFVILVPDRIIKPLVPQTCVWFAKQQVLNITVHARTRWYMTWQSCTRERWSDNILIFENKMSILVFYIYSCIMHTKMSWGLVRNNCFFYLVPCCLFYSVS